MSRTLEVTVLSAENLRINQKSVKKNAFVSVQPESSNACTTRMDSEGGSYPSWNEKLVMDLPMHARFITAEVKCKTTMGITSVGIAQVPVSDFLGGYIPENQLHFLSYRLWDSKCRRNGVINISVRVKIPENCFQAPSRPVKGIPAPVADQTKIHAHAHGVVTGIPVYWSNSAPNKF
ncbi:hypothetical protein L6164_003825 [Bauhinia variegata]|uniref:Uncharacterized protein n=1 Tax=Bauhinia variegata TaxID=167791 RepID=A0ACB9Q576_BAUVA|nr:hypothetical protein L6164_003825 [Bauhinia variegata]